MKPVPLAALLTLGAAQAAWAQTNDHLYRSWQWSPASGSPRAAGLAGAFVAVADDASGVAVNPAGMLLLPKSELAVDLYHVRSGTVGVGDRRGSASGLGFVGGTGRLGPRFAIGGYLSQPRKEALTLEPIPLPDGSLFAGSLSATVTEGGGAVAYSVGRKLNLGLRVAATHLELEGAYTRAGSSVLPDLESGTAAGHTRITGSFGALYGGPDDRLRLGLTVHAGASYTATRTANDPRIGGIDTGSEYEVRQPASVAAGAAFHLSPKLLLAAQLNFVRHSEIEPFRRPGTVSEGSYAVDDAMDPAVAAEFSHPFGRWGVQRRAGIASRAQGALSYAGPNDTERLAFRAQPRETVVAIGGSLVQGNGASIDVAAMFGGASSWFVGGARLRF
jgi:hypothetical protein